MGAKVQHRIGLVVLAQIAVEGAEGVCGGKAFFKQQAHRVAFITKGGLHSDQHIAQLQAQHKQAAAIGQVLARGRAPLGFNLTQPFFVLDMVRHWNVVHHIGLGAVLSGVAMQQRFTQRIDTFRQLHLVALRGQVVQGVEQGFKHRQISCGAHGTRIGWEVENHHRDLAVGTFGLTQVNQLLHPGRQHVRAFGASEHVLGLVCFGEGASTLATGASGALGTRASAVHHGHGGTVEFGNSHHDGAFHRQQTAIGAAPLIEGLKLHRVCCNVGHIELLQSFLRGFGIVVSRAAHQRKTCEGHQGLNQRGVALFEIRINGATRIQATGKSGDDAQALGFQGLDDCVVMGGVAGQQIRTQHQQTHSGLVLAFDVGQVAGFVGEQTLHARVVDAYFGVFDG